MPNKQEHQPVLLEAVLDYLAPMEGETYLDLTAGYGGHALEVLERTMRPSSAVLVDRDENAIKHLQQLSSLRGSIIVHDDFLQASKHLVDQKQSFDMILADIGVSSPHLNIASRGFSIAQDGPLDMRMDQRQELTADKLVNEADLAELERIIRSYGEEPHARRIAKAIVEARPLHTTTQLANIITALPGLRRGKLRIHPATKTFQALRIAVNDELAMLEEALPLWLDILSPGGRIAVISFHSLEDRIVKRILASRSGNRYDATLELLTKKPVVATNNEIVQNPRARSAKLRAAAKINKKRR